MADLKGYARTAIPVFLSSFLAYFYFIGTVPLGYMYQSFPGQDALTILVATLPGVTAMIGAFGCAPLMRVMRKKTIVVASLVLAIVGSLVIRFVGTQSLELCIVASALMGFLSGAAPSVNYVVLTETAPEGIRDKVVGWNDGFSGAGLLVFTFLAGLLSADGDWARTYALGYAIIPVLAAVVLLYPDSYEVAAESAEAASAEEVEEPKVPASAFAIIVLKFIVSMFVIAVSLNISDLVINERAIGDAGVVGNIATIYSLAFTVGTFLVFTVLSRLKGLAPFFQLLLVAAELVVIALFRELDPVVIGILVGIGSLGGSVHSSMATLCTLATKGKAVETVSSLFTGATFVGELLCGYVPPIVAGLVLGEATPSNNLLVSGIACAIFAIITIPVCNAAYKLAFPDEA